MPRLVDELRATTLAVERAKREADQKTEHERKEQARQQKLDAQHKRRKKLEADIQQVLADFPEQLRQAASGGARNCELLRLDASNCEFRETKVQGKKTKTPVVNEPIWDLIRTLGVEGIRVAIENRVRRVGSVQIGGGGRSGDGDYSTEVPYSCLVASW